MDVDRAADIPVQARIEQAPGIRQGRALGEGQLHRCLVGLAGAENAGMFPHRHAAPLPRLFHLGIGFADDCPHPCQCLAAPVVQGGDAGVDLLGGGLVFAHAFLAR